MKKNLLFLALVFSFYASAQERLVLPGQELLFPNLVDPSMTAEERRTQITAIGQFVDFDSERSTQYVNAQLPIYDNLSFGLDYFNNNLDYYKFSQVLLSAAFEIPTGENSHVKVGLSGGGESLKLDRIPLAQQDPNLVPNINENNISFTYRVGLHFNNRNLMLGGYYATLPSQRITPQQDQEDLLNYNLGEGLTAYLGYHISVGQRFRITPMFRYLSFIDEPIYEGSLKFQFREKVDLALAYRNDYSINPAIRLQFFKSLMVGYSFEKAIGDLVFEDIHSFSLSYKFNKSNAEDEPDWMETAKENIEKTETLEKSKPKKKKKDAAKETSEEMNPQKENTVIEEPKNAISPQAEAKEVPVVKEETPVQKKEVQDSEQRKPITRAVVIEMSPRFYLVAKSFDNYADAFVFKKELENNGVNALIGSIEKDEKFYVYVDSDISKVNANNRLKNYKGQAILKSIYVLEVD